MDNLNIDINLMKLSRVGVASIHGLRCVVIPIDENDIFVSQDQQTGKAKGAYLHLTAWTNKNGVGQYGDTHYVKQSYSKEYRDAHPDAKAPIIGNGKPVQGQQSQVNTVAAPNVDSSLDPNSDDLPF